MPGGYAPIAPRSKTKEAAETALAERSAAFDADLARRDIGLDAVVAALPPRTAVVSFVRYDRTAPAPSARPAPQQPLLGTRGLRRRRPPRSEADPVLVHAGDAATVEALVTRWRRAVVHDSTRRRRSHPSRIGRFAASEPRCANGYGIRWWRISTESIRSSSCLTVR